MAEEKVINTEEETKEETTEEVQTTFNTDPLDVLVEEGSVENEYKD